MSLFQHFLRAFVEPRHNQSINQSINDFEERMIDDFESDVKLPPAFDSIRTSSEPVHSHRANYSQANQSINQSTNQSHNQSTSQSVTQSYNQSNHSNYSHLAHNHSHSNHTSHSQNQVDSRSYIFIDEDETSQSINQPINRSFNQPINRSFNQSGNQSNQQPNYHLNQSRSFIVIDEDDRENENFSVVLEDHSQRNDNNQMIDFTSQLIDLTDDLPMDEVDLTEILDLGYTVRQALFAVNLFRDRPSDPQSFDPSHDYELEHTLLIQQAISYLIDMDDHPDVLEAQIVQMEVEQERQRMISQSTNQPNARSRSVLGRFFPRLQSFSRSLSVALSGSPSPTLDRSLDQSIYQMVHSPQSATLQRSVSSPGVMMSLSQSISDQSINSTNDQLMNRSFDLDDSPLSKDLPFIQPDPPQSFFSPWACRSCTFIHQVDVDQSLDEAINCSICSSVRPLSHEESAYQSSLQACEICLMSYPPTFFPSCPPCGHAQFCLGCTHDFVSSKIFDLGQLLAINCLSPGCKRPMTQSELVAVLSPHDYSRYLRFKRSAELSLDPRIRYCTNLRCQNVLLGQAMAPRMRCDKCSHETCFNCQMRWHDGVTCVQVQQIVSQSGDLGATNGVEADISFLQFLSQSNDGQTRFRQCPSCRCWLERAAGCAKMTCRCGANFCFVCGSINATCACTPRFHVFYPLHTVLGNWNGTGPE